MFWSSQAQDERNIFPKLWFFSFENSNYYWQKKKRYKLISLKWQAHFVPFEGSVCHTRLLLILWSKMGNKRDLWSQQLSLTAPFPCAEVLCADSPHLATQCTLWRGLRGWDSVTGFFIWLKYKARKMSTNSLEGSYAHHCTSKSFDMIILVIAVCPQFSHQYFDIIGTSINTVIKLVIFSYSYKNKIDHTSYPEIPLRWVCGAHLETSRIHSLKCLLQLVGVLPWLSVPFFFIQYWYVLLSISKTPNAKAMELSCF